MTVFHILLAKPAGAAARATRLLPSFPLLQTAIGGPVQTKGLFPWRSEGNLSLELGMQSFVLGQRSKPRLFVLHCERLFYTVPIHSPSVQGMGTLICANSHRRCKNNCIKDMRHSELMDIWISAAEREDCDHIIPSAMGATVST